MTVNISNEASSATAADGEAGGVLLLGSNDNAPFTQARAA